MSADTVSDKFQFIGWTTGVDLLSPSPIGTKGTPVSGPYALGSNGDQPPAADLRLSWYAMAGGSPAPAAP